MSSQPPPTRNASRQSWGTRWGMVLALAGNAVGLGNFLRFPRQAAENGGGAFMIPYFVALLVIGLPMMWMECAIGRYGGKHGHGHTAGMFDAMWDHPLAKYAGSLGVFLPFVIATYYIYITSWCLAFSVFSLIGTYNGLQSREQMGAFLGAFQGVTPDAHFASVLTAYVFFLVTLAMTVGVLMGGIAKGIERLAKAAMPLLFLIGIFLVVRVLMFGTPDPAVPERNVWAGLGFVWNPRFDALADPQVWVAAAGQIFFTLSIGWGIVHTYASYLGENDDVALTGAATVGLNEFAEVVLGGTIALTAAVAFFGIDATREIAESGSFDLGFQALPVIFQRIPAGGLVGCLWFLLLFFAGLTSAVAMAQPLIALLEETWNVPNRRAVLLVAAALFVLTQPVILFKEYGFLDELDYWAGEVGLVAFGFLEVVIFAWIFGIERGWQQIEHGAAIRPSRLFMPVLKYATPLFLGGILLLWLWHEVPAKLAMEGVPEQSRPYLIGARVLLVSLLAATFWIVHKASYSWGKGASRFVK